MSYVPGHHGEDRGPFYRVETETECWVWARPLTRGQRYPVFKKRRAHVVFYEKRFGPVPEGLELDHLCRNKLCVNPDHLEAVTHTENVRRGAHTKLTWADVRAIRASDAPRDQLAEAFGIKRSHVERVISGRIWKDAAYTPPSKRGVVLRPKIAKLTPDDALAIRASSESSSALARVYDVSRASIQNVRKRATFKYLP